MSTPTPRLWSLPLIGAVTILTNFFAGILLASMNWRSMGSRDTAKNWLVGGLVGVALFAVLIVFVPSAVALQVHLAVNIATYFALQRALKPDLQAFQASNPPTAPRHWLPGCGIGLLVSLGLGVAILSITIVLSLVGVDLPE